MFKKSLSALICLIIPLLRANEMAEFGSNCLIHNVAFSHGYLFSSNENKHKETTSHQAKNQVSVRPLGKVKDFNNIRWSFVETSKQSDQFYLKSSQFEDYLCATNSYADFWNTKRVVKRLKIDKSSDFLDNCKWRMIRVDLKTSNGTYLIKNMYYDEPLYAMSYFFQRWVDNREVYLWHKKNEYKKNFKWIIDCQTGNYLWI